MEPSNNSEGDGFRYPTREEAMEGRKQRAEMRRLRREALGPQGRDAEDRAKKAASRNSHTAGIDLISLALERPSELIEPQRLALLGRPVHWPDGTAFLQALTGYEKQSCGDYIKFQFASCSPRGSVVHLSPNICKFTLCDWRLPSWDSYDGNANAAVEVMYQEQLQLERDDAPLERARQVARNDIDKAARSYARMMLRGYEAMQESGLMLSPKEVWESVKPRVPAWMQEISKNNEEYGFVFYKAAELLEREAAWSRWITVFQDDMDPYLDSYVGHRVAAEGVRDGHIIEYRMCAEWVEDVHLPGDDPQAFRE